MAPATSTSSAPNWMPVVRSGSGRRCFVDCQRLEQAAAVRGLGLGPPVALSGRRRVALDGLLAAARARTIGGVIVSRLETFSACPAQALSILAELGASVPVVVIDQQWAGDLAAQLAPVAEYLTAATQQQRAEAGRTAIAVAKARGVPVGRPSRPVPDSAIDLARRIGVGRASKVTGIAPTTLRRAVRARSAAATCVMNVGDYFATTTKEGHHAEHEEVAVAG